MQQKLNTGLTHLLGAFSVMLSQSNKKLLAGVDTKSLSLLLQKLDLHVPTYGVCHRPELPPFPPVAENIVASYPPDKALFKILHSCFHFNARAFQYKYTSRRLIPPEMLIEQGRQLGILKQWLSHNELPSNWDAESYEPLVVLRAQCLTALINTSNILDPRERAYDCYGPEFQEIITTIEALLLDREVRVDHLGDVFGALPSFIPEMGIIHPLYFTAKKYRNSFWRRKALNLILRSGKEGPWCAETEGSITEAIIKTEEGNFDRASLNLSRSEDPKLDAPSNVPEEKRINACWTIDENGEEGEPDRVTRKRFTKAIFYRCIDIDALLADDEAQKARSWPWVDSKWWEQWIGELEKIV
ncbi:hypothetical protein NW768_008309 [Fusarium equiseti]|uniref:Uncharacterized protein n=1 Tax=Fusarium equiseti TaxID=61235 RepID=A0ABQ8R6M5_FUSEQ|nr:hypothetical protein NW768_008309 [Fusarium equiseti]